MSDKEPTFFESLQTFPYTSSTEKAPFVFGVELSGEWWEWRERLDAPARALRRLTRAVNKVVDGAVLLCLGVSFALFAVTTFVLLPSAVWSRFLFWQSPSPEQFWLWLAVNILLYYFYRLSRRRREPKLRIQKKETAIPIAVTEEERKKISSVKRVFIEERCSEETRRGIESSADLAESFAHDSLDVLHLFAGQLPRPSVGQIFARLGLSFEAIRDPLARRLATLPKGNGSIRRFGPSAERVVLGAVLSARREGRTVVTPVDILVACFATSPFLRELFADTGVEEEAVSGTLSWMSIREQLRARWQSFREAAFLKPTGPVNRAYTSRATPLLDSVSTDLTELATRYGVQMLVGREEELARTLRVFESGGRSVILVGESGVGKRAIVGGLAERMVSETVPALLQDKRLVSIDVPRLLAGASPSETEERLLRLLGEVGMSKNIALALPSVDDLSGVSASGGEGLDLATVLAQEIEKGYFVCVATTTPTAYRRALENTALGNVFTKVIVEEPEVQEAIRVLEAHVGRPESEHSVLFTYAALSSCVLLSGRFLHDAFLPEKAIRIMDESAMLARGERGTGATVTKEDVAKVVSSASRVPLTAVAEDEKEKLLHLEDVLHNRVIGQDEAVKMVASALRRARTSLRSGSKPIANLLFLGPTGVGKTELARAVAEAYFGEDDAMTRLDMSEYQEAGSMNRLLGTPGSGQGGIFTEEVRAKPFALVLLDELEKANNDVLNAFLQVMEDGRLTDAVGRTVDFTQTIIIATSNAGAGYIQQAIRAGTAMDEIKTKLLEDELQRVYRPEFLNRFDGIVVFSPLTPEHMRKITDLLIAKVASRLEEKGIVLNVTDSARLELSVAGYDPQFGARPLRRVIQERVEDKLATMLLEGKVKRRDTIVFDVGGEVRIEEARAL